MKTNFHLVPSLFVGLASLLPSSLAVTVLGAWTPPAAAASDDPHQILETTGVQGGLLWVLSATDGKKLAECRLDAPPVFDGLAVARGRLYASTTDGKVRCLGTAVAR